MASEQPFLRVTKGQAAGLEIPLAESVHFGRNAEGDGSLGGDAELSREHATVEREPSGGYRIQDLGSMNGTFVNGKRITEPTPIQPGDKILLGASELELVGTLPVSAQPTAVAATPIVPLEAQPTRVAQPAAPPPEAPPGPPPGVGGPPPGAGGPPPGVGGPPPGAGGRPKLKDLPPPIAERIRRLAMIAAVVGFLIGFGIATLVWQVL